eukprot:5809323-Alexandrium_andersonii.AAC.1
MSASLVGSEMCIRDSEGPDRLPEHRTSSAWAKPDEVVALPDEIAGLAQAVSYTHLTLPTICSV